jgi:hypothetical protein
MCGEWAPRQQATLYFGAEQENQNPLVLIHRGSRREEEEESEKKKRVRGGGGLPLPQVSWSVRSSSSGFGSLPAEQFWWTSSRTIRPRCSSSLWKPTDLETVGYPLMDHEEACNKKDGWPYLREIQGLPEDQVSRPTGNHHAPPVSIITGVLPVLFTHSTVQEEEEYTYTVFN